MAEPRARTLQERMGFRDDELKTPKHDEIMLWLDANIQIVMDELHGPIGDWDVKEVSFIQKEYLERASGMANKFKQQGEWASEEVKKNSASYAASRIKSCTEGQLRWSSWAGLGTPDRARRLQVLRKTWERPVTTGRDNNYVVGFIDLQVVTIHGVRLNVAADLDYEGVFKADPEWRETTDTETWNLEVKSSIPSLGELIRQISFYRQYVEAAHWVVVCPDTRFREPLMSQGILLVQYSNP